MKKLFAAMLLLVIGVVLIPTIQNSVDNYDIVGTSETFTAASDDSTAEDFTLVEETPTAITSVTVNGTAIELTTDYTVDGSVITLVAAASDTDDTVVINYDYQYDMPTGVDGMVNIVLIIFVIGVVIGGVAYIKFST